MDLLKCNFLKSKANRYIDKSGLNSLFLYLILASALLISLHSVYHSKLGVNQEVFFGNAFLSDTKGSLLKGLESYWELKTPFHRLYILIYYKFTNLLSPSVTFTSSWIHLAKFLSYLCSVAFIILGVLVGKKNLENSKVPNEVVIITALILQMTLIKKTFEIEEAIFSLSIFTFCLGLSKSRTCIFILPFFLLLLSLLKLVTLLLAISILFSIYLFKKPTRDQYFIFLIGSLTLLITFLATLLQFPFLAYDNIFSIQINNSVAPNLETIFSVSPKRYILQCLYYPPLFLGNVFLFLILSIKENRKPPYFKFQLLTVFIFCFAITIVQNRFFTYHFLPMAFPIFIAIIACRKLTKNRNFSIDLRVFLLLSLAYLIYPSYRYTPIDSTVAVGVLFVASLTILHLFKKLSFDPAWYAFLFLALLGEATLNKEIFNNQSSREIRTELQFHEISRIIKDSQKLVYLSFGNSVFHLQKISPCKLYSGIHFNRIQKRKNLHEHPRIIENVNCIIKSKAKYILYEEAHFNLRLFKTLHNHIQNNYKQVKNTGLYRLYKKTNE